MADTPVTYVTKDMLISEIIAKFPPAAYALMGCGMGCVHCGAAQGESPWRRPPWFTGWTRTKSAPS